MIEKVINELIFYGLEKGLLEKDDAVWARNSLLELLGLSDYKEPADEKAEKRELCRILEDITDEAVKMGLVNDDITSRDLFDTAVMGILTPRPSAVRRCFWEKYAGSPEGATDWYYSFSQNTNYIRTDRIKKDLKWKTKTEYGDLDITINLSKPEKDPKAIAAALTTASSDYPSCLLCSENEGYAGHFNHPARQNHRLIPLTLDGEDWFLQYSPYVYYNEHCIVLNGLHTPMKINRSAFNKLLSFIEIFPHYFVGSNADLPIVGGSILTHDHFQGGRFVFAMEKAPIEQSVEFEGFSDVKCGIVRWPMSVLRLRCSDKDRLVELADKILTAWRGYTDETAFIFAETDGTPHNTITPIARRRGSDFELDLVLRNNITTEEYPLGVYHPHSELHHIKKENIGLIEVMGLAVLPARLKEELSVLGDLLVGGKDLRANEKTAHHADWAEELKKKYDFTAENVTDILKEETGKVFSKVLEHAGVFKRTDEGRKAFLRFTDSIK